MPLCSAHLLMLFSICRLPGQRMGANQLWFVCTRLVRQLGLQNTTVCCSLIYSLADWQPGLFPVRCWQVHSERRRTRMCALSGPLAFVVCFWLLLCVCPSSPSLFCVVFLFSRWCRDALKRESATPNKLADSISKLNTPLCLSLPVVCAFVHVHTVCMHAGWYLQRH